MDYPLPPAFNRAFEASSRLVLEEDPKVSLNAEKHLYKSGFYSGKDNLKNHVDPRTYDYLRRFFGLLHVPESRLAKCRPWMLIMMLWSPSTNTLGVEAFLLRRAHAISMPVSGLETFQEHAEIISGMSDHQAELVLLDTFISQTGGGSRETLMNAWRRGDANEIERFERQSFKNLPSFRVRLIEDRNRNWIPKIEHLLRGHDTCFVVAGAAHMGGPNGVVELLKRRGYRVDQL